MESVAAAIRSIGDSFAGNFLLALTLAGTLTMAILQTIKNLVPLRRAFQRQWIEQWIAARGARFNAALEAAPSAANPAGGALKPANTDETKTMLVDLATGGQENAFYDLQSEQLVAQMNAAAQISLDYPGHYYQLLVVISQGADLPDVDIVTATSSARAAAASPDGLPANYSDARTRLSHRIQRNLDGLQIAMADQWAWRLQVASLIISTVLIELALLHRTGLTAGSFISGIFIGIIGGYFAPVTRDLVAALQGLRK